MGGGDVVVLVHANSMSDDDVKNTPRCTCSATGVLTFGRCLSTELRNSLVALAHVLHTAFTENTPRLRKY